MSCKIDDYEADQYRIFTSRMELDKALHTLDGIIKGITIDNNINLLELNELKSWYEYHSKVYHLHPFSEIMPIISRALANNKLDIDEMKDVLWLCRKMTTDNLYYDKATSDMQRLQGILHGILADGKITVDELKGLTEWLDENYHLATIYPYDEIYGLVAHVLSDGIITQKEHLLLKSFFKDFVSDFSSNIDWSDIAEYKKDITKLGVCSVCPKLGIPEKNFCFTGKSSKTTRQQFSNIIEALGGIYNDNVTQSTDYLIIGNEGNPCWAFSCYGRKVEKAVNLRKNGSPLSIVHETDFWDFYTDFVEMLPKYK